MAERGVVRELSNDEGRKLLSIVRRGSGSVVRWRRAQVVVWSAQRMDVPAIAQIAFTSEDRVREVVHNVNLDGFEPLAPKDAGGRPPGQVGRGGRPRTSKATTTAEVRESTPRVR